MKMKNIEQGTFNISQWHLKASCEPKFNAVV